LLPKATKEHFGTLHLRSGFVLKASLSLSFYELETSRWIGLLNYEFAKANGGNFPRAQEGGIEKVREGASAYFVR